MSKSIVVPVGQVDQAKIDGWKKSAKYGIYALEVSDMDGNAHIGYFKNPSLHEANCASSKNDPDAPFALVKELAELCFLGGSEAILNDDQMFMSAAGEIKASIGNRTVRMVNL